MPTVNERCDRVHLINVLEKEGLCLRCSYCIFLKKLKNRLQELSFFTTNVHVQTWDVQYKNDILTVEPVGASFSLDQKVKEK